MTERLGDELRLMASWLGVSEFVVPAASRAATRENPTALEAITEATSASR